MTRDELRKEWIAALRSGKYKQGQGALHEWDRFCCLGVLCEIAADAGIVTRHGPSYDDGRHRTTTLLPRRLARLIGLENPEETHLMAMNDIEGNSFPEIAEHIEKRVFA